MKSWSSGDNGRGTAIVVMSHRNLEALEDLLVIAVILFSLVFFINVVSDSTYIQDHISSELPNMIEEP